MAKTSITNAKMSFNTAVAIPTAVAVGSEGSEYIAEVNYTGKDDSRILLMFENAATSSKSVTIKKGTGLQGVEDLTFSLTASGKFALVVESGKFVNNEGNVVIAGADANVKVSVLELP